DERQRSQRAAALLLIQLRRALEQPAVKIEHVARIRLAPRWTAKQQRNFAIRSRVLREVVVNDQCMAAVVAEKFANRAARIGRDILHGRRVGSGGSDNDGVIHRAEIRECFDNLGDRGTLLSDGDIDANNVAALLIDDRVESKRGLAGLAVANDQLALAAADRDHGIDGLDSSL